MPHEGSDVNLKQAEYSLPYYEKWEKQTDGAIGEAFSQMAKFQQTMLGNGGAAEDENSDLFAGWFTLARICGTPGFEGS